MKHLIAFLFTLTTCLPLELAAQAIPENPLKTAEAYSIYTDNAFRGTDSVAYFYEADGTLISQINFNRSGDDWQPTFRQLYQYDGTRNLTLLQSEKFEDGQWLPRYRTLYDQYQGDQPGYEENQSWSVERGWQPNVRFETTYNNQGERVSQLRYQPDGQGNLTPFTQSTFAYSPDNQIIEAITDIWKGNGWQAYFSTTYTYDAMGRQTDIINRSEGRDASRTSYQYLSGDSLIITQYQYDLTAQGWKPQTRNVATQNRNALPLIVRNEVFQDSCGCFIQTGLQTYRWDGERLMENTSQLLSKGILENRRRIVYQYNDGGCVVYQAFFEGDGTTWIPVNSRHIEVDDYCQPLLETTEKWDGQSLQPASQRRHYYQQDGNAPFASFPTISIAPNPAQDYLHIYLTDDQLLGNTQFSLLDLSGKRVQSGSCVAPTTRLSVSHLTPGIYLLKLDFGTSQQLTKVWIR